MRAECAPTLYAYGSLVSINSIERKKSSPFEFVHRNRRLVEASPEPGLPLRATGKDVSGVFTLFVVMQAPEVLDRRLALKVEDDV